MGRRAKKAPVQTKKRATLAKQFKCPFCANENVVECKMDFRNSVGSVECRVCGASYQMPIHHLNEAIDVFSEWLDACEAAETGKVPGSEAAPPPQEDEDDSDDELPPPPIVNNRNESNKASKPAASKKSKKPKATAPAPTADYSALGLDDSDDSDDE
mmetsp:Transcript_6424/g.9271  ORF Transcript_6424/g.9271 Transcript_6424/m.9271 type:complete len:157 (-) Transcript_6424:121-591(-)